MANIVNKEKFDELINSNELVIVDFFAQWCGPCQMFIPVFDGVSEKLTDINMIKIDIDKENQLALINGVQGVPTIIAYKDGKEVSRFSGFKPETELISFIESVK